MSIGHIIDYIEFFSLYFSISCVVENYNLSSVLLTVGYRMRDFFNLLTHLWQRNYV